MADSFMQQLIASLARRTPVLDEPVSYQPRSSLATDQSSPISALLPEDRPDFERTLDEVLTADAPGSSGRLNPEQLRTMALTADEIIAEAAAHEYAHYVEVRKRDPGSGTDDQSSSTVPAGAGLLAVVAVLFPVLSGAGTAIFLIVGYLLKLVNSESPLASSLISGGWVFAALTAASMVVTAVGLLLTALRNTPPMGVAQNEEVVAARDAWLQALRRRGIEPFLRDVRKAVDGVVDAGQQRTGKPENDI
ncbi:hypothetical protein ACFWPQ_33695 [Streptomyces sp. NPDC058464]|uniref:hypothetical protein n=1 Tax=Streptomyces sp. NPDC058464 TaxID=3346511 RepID=UPI00365FA5BD